jgi:GT2 family glycosyltransferase
MFEAAFFAYVEDVDLSIRISREAGRTAAEPEADMVHTGGATSGGSTSQTAQFLYTRNTWLMLRRNAPHGSGTARWLRFAAHSAQRAAAFAGRGAIELAHAVTAGISAARREEFGAPPARLVASLYERSLVRYPWRSAQLLTATARWLERRAPGPEAAAPASRARVAERP